MLEIMSLKYQKVKKYIVFKLQKREHISELDHSYLNVYSKYMFIYTTIKYNK